MVEWYDQKEQSAGKLRLLFLWYIYKFFNLAILRIILVPIVFVIYIFSKNSKIASKNYQKVLNAYQAKHNIPLSRFTPFQHILGYANSLADKMSVLCDEKSPIKYEIAHNNDWKLFEKKLNSKKGVFLISSHLGNVEAFSGYAKYSKKKYKLHALMETSQSSIFHQFIESHAQKYNFTLYSTDEMNFARIMCLYERVQAGDIILMAGDRVSAKNPEQYIYSTLLSKKCSFPRGTFRFAQKFNVPVFAIFLIKTKRNTYLISLKEIKVKTSLEEMINQYARCLEEMILRYPSQWYNFYSYFS